MPRVILVTGMGGSQTWEPAIRKYYESKGYQVDTITYDQYDPWTYRDYDVHAGHSLGSMAIQMSFTPSSKIQTWGSPMHFRGEQMNNFIEGHKKNPEI